MYDGRSNRKTDASRVSKKSMAFIDRLHIAKGVEVDFGLAYTHLVQGGILVFDDYFEESIPDYTHMIDTLMIKHDLVLIKDRDSRLVYLEKITRWLGLFVIHFCHSLELAPTHCVPVCRFPCQPLAVS